jgi:hypothetical protein
MSWVPLWQQGRSTKTEHVFLLGAVRLISEAVVSRGYTFLNNRLDILGAFYRMKLWVK